MRAVLLILIAVLFAGCIESELLEPRRVPRGEFSSTILPLLEKRCGGSDCHGGGPRGFAGGLDLTSHEGIFRGSRYGTVVVSGHPFMSHLIQSINRTDTTLSPISSVPMPASRDPLPQEEVETIVRWIREGARDDDGWLPFPEPRPLGKVFFSSQSVDLVGVLDLQTNLIMRYVTVGNELPFSTPPQSPHNVQIDDQGRFYYVTLIRSNMLRKFDAVTHDLVGEVNAGTSPAHVVITADGAKAYVTNFEESMGRVHVVGTADMSVIRTITHPSLMNRAHGARLSHDGRFLYVGGYSRDMVAVIQTATDSIVTFIPVGFDVPPIGSNVYRPYQIAVRGDDRFLYVTCLNRAQVSVIERMGDSFVLRDTIGVGQRPLQCEVTPDQRFLYVCNQGSNSVTVIDAQTHQRVTTIADVGKQPHGIDVTADSRLVYVTCENVLGGDPPHHPLTGSTAPGFVVMIDVASNRVVQRIEVGGFAAGMSVFPGKGN